jgi:SAM-dependent methyltransferase
MSHPEQIELVHHVKNQFPAFFTQKKVLEIGSLDINGSVRGLFNDCDYTGLDIAPGKGVDVVCMGQDYDAPDDSFDAVISCEAMEHNPYWQATMVNMIRLTKPGGLVIMTCATIGRAEHGTSRTDAYSSPLTVEQGWTYYCNLTGRDILRNVTMSALAAYDFATNWDTYDLYFLAVKSDQDAERISAMKQGVTDILNLYRRRQWTSLKWIRRSIQKPLQARLFRN